MNTMNKTSKEKALELCMYFQNLLFINLTNEQMIHSDSKKCALKVCEEIMNLTTINASKEKCFNHIEYWRKVKKEIEKL